jgi:hypothetical protein
MLRRTRNLLALARHRFQQITYFVLHPRAVKKRFEFYLKRSSDDRKAKQGYYDYPHSIIFLAGMALGGSTWMKNLLAGIPGYYTRRTPMPWVVSYNADICDSAFRYTPHNGYTLFKTHLNPTPSNLECISNNGVTKILVTYRDFRDVALSRCHRLMAFPKPITAEDYVDYQKMGFNHALEHSILHIAKVYVPWIEKWYEFAEKEPDRYCFIKFEDMKADTYHSFKKVLEFYEISLDDELIQNIINKAKGKGSVKDNIRSASVLPWGESSSFRSGTIGGWRLEYSQEHINLAKEKFGSSLITLGYKS